MKKIPAFLISFLVVFLFFLLVFSYKNNIWSVYSPIHRPDISHHKNPHLFYGVNVDMSQLLPTSERYIHNAQGQDLIDIAHSIGINLFRITSSAESFPITSGNTIYTKSEWEMVLNKMNREGIKAIILVEAPELDPRIYTQPYQSFLKQYIIDTQILSNPDIYAIDIKNEPLITKSNIDYLQQAASEIKSHYPQMKVTIGSWKAINPNPHSTQNQYVWNDPASIPLFANIVDFYSVHIYGYDVTKFGIYPNAYNLTNYTLQQIHTVHPQKPILVEEFGAGNGDAITDQNTIGSSQLQANVYTDVFNATLANSDFVLGSVGYTLYPRDINTNGWNIIRNNGNYRYPATISFKLFTQFPGKYQTLPYQQIPNDFLYTMASNSRTSEVDQGDILGIQLPLPNPNGYTLSIDQPQDFTISENLQYNNQQHMWNAVLHAVQKGQTTLTVLDNQQAVFSLHVNIH